MKIKMMMFTMVMVFVSGCSTMNDQFGCNQTAGDSCLTIDEVNAMTEPKGEYRRHKVFQNTEVLKNNKDMSGSLWIAPHKSNGQLMAEQTLRLRDTAGRG